jgi:hypothetical protein
MRRHVFRAFGLAGGALSVCVGIAQIPDLPPVGSIDFYGLRTISEAEVRELLPFKEGDALPMPPPDSLDTDVASTLGVARVAFELVCCNESGLSQVYVGIEETIGNRTPYLDTPTGEDRLPQEIVATYQELMDRWMEAVLSGDAGEDRSQGHALSDYAPARVLQERFIIYAEQYRERLLNVLHESANAEHRAIAAWVLGYVQDKTSVTADLAQAARDPNGEVRNNATRALSVIAQYAKDNPELEIEIRADPFIDMLNSIAWTDRNKSLGVVSTLSETREPGLLEELKQRALRSLIDMCRWKDWGHAVEACLILQRITGLTDDSEPTARGSTIARAIQLLPPDAQFAR